VIEPPELEFERQLVVNGRPLLREVVDAVGDDAEHLESVRHPPAVPLRQLRVEAGHLIPVLAFKAGLKDAHPHQFGYLAPRPVAAEDPGRIG